jgi:tetratricopeptide (TPR) repeat protein
MNSRLAALRSKAVIAYIEDYIPDQWRDSVKASHMPENWGQLRLIVANDTLISADSRKKILSITGDLKRPDEVEMQLSQIPEYRYLREKVYPQLRSVSFDFHLHRAGMQKDTVHTAELDTVYMAGLLALRNLDYRTAVEKLRPYRDYNTALAFMTADYNHSALDVLNGLDDRNAKVCYLKALILARLGVPEEAMKYFELCLTYDPYMRYRANLDPEMSDLIKRINLK